MRARCLKWHLQVLHHFWSLAASCLGLVALDDSREDSLDLLSILISSSQILVLQRLKLAIDRFDGVITFIYISLEAVEH